MAASHATEHGYALALEEARRTLDEQERTVADLGTRSGTLLAAAAIAMSVLGGPILARDSIDTAALVAVLAFVAQSVATLSILVPRRNWEFSLRPAAIIATHIEPVDQQPDPIPLIQRDMALRMNRSADSNREQVNRMATSFHASSVLLTIEIVLWVVSTFTTS